MSLWIKNANIATMDEQNPAATSAVVIGDFFAHEFEVHGGGRTIARVYKEWFTWGDTYAIEIATGIDEIAALSVVLALDAIISADRN